MKLRGNESRLSFHEQRILFLSVQQCLLVCFVECEKIHQHDRARIDRRAQLVVLTDKGKQTFDAAMRLQAPWINILSEGLSLKDIGTVQHGIAALRQKLENNQPGK